MPSTRGALADRVDVRVGGAAGGVDDEPPRSPSSSPHGRASSSRGRMPAREHDEVDGRAPSPSATAAATRTACRRARPRGGRRAGVHGHAELLDVAAQQPAPPPSSTWTGISRGASSTTWVARPERAQRVARPPVRAGRRRPPRRMPAGRQRPRRSPDRLEVIDRAVHEAAGQVVARASAARTAPTRWPAPARRSVTLGARGGDDDPRARGRRRRPARRGGVLARRRRRELARAQSALTSSDSRTISADPVVGGARLLAEDHDPPVDVAVEQRLDHPVADHAVAGDDEGPRHVASTPSAARRSSGGVASQVRELDRGCQRTPAQLTAVSVTTSGVGEAGSTVAGTTATQYATTTSCRPARGRRPRGSRQRGRSVSSLAQDDLDEHAAERADRTGDADHGRGCADSAVVRRRLARRPTACRGRSTGSSCRSSRCPCRRAGTSAMNEPKKSGEALRSPTPIDDAGRADTMPDEHHERHLRARRPGRRASRRADGTIEPTSAPRKPSPPGRWR